MRTSEYDLGTTWLGCPVIGLALASTLVPPLHPIPIIALQMLQEFIPLQRVPKGLCIHTDCECLQLQEDFLFRENKVCVNRCEDTAVQEVIELKEVVIVTLAPDMERPSSSSGV